MKTLQPPKISKGILPAWLKLLITMPMAFSAFLVRGVDAMLALTLVNLVYLLLSRARLKALLLVAPFFITQTLVICGLYLFRFGTPDAIINGLMVAWRVILSLLPGFILLNSTAYNEMLSVFDKILPPKASFVISTCLRFIPVVVGESRNIYEAQVMRGARILPRDLLNPLNWRDLAHCLLLPLVVYIFKLTHDIYIAAKARNLEHLSIY